MSVVAAGRSHQVAGAPPPERPLPEIHAAVLDWYAANGRDLAFRRTTDPWAILVSEVMAQQTQAARAADHWTRFIGQFPTPAALAAASPAAVIRAWRGLGYNRRAVALRAAALRIVEDHGGRVPASIGALEALPGVGPYTARAVLAFAFDRPVAPLDTNVRRVLDRALGALPSPGRARQAAADEAVPATAAAGWAHALMDIGATICLARLPRCDACPIQHACRARTAATARMDVAVGRVASPRRPGQTGAFPATTRWLRGRIVDQLRNAADGTWVTFDRSIGEHAIRTVHVALERLAHDRLIERDATSPGRARLLVD